MRYILSLSLVLTLAMLACKQGPLTEEKEKKDDGGDETPEAAPAPGTLAVGQQAAAGIVVAATNLTKVSEAFVPQSMKPGEVAIAPQGALLLDGPPLFCQNNPSHQMCTSCGPGGALDGQQACATFFGPGGEGFTEGETLGGTEGGQDGPGGGGDDGPGGDEGQGPCEGLGFFDCQPVLVKLYLKIARESVARVGGTLDQAKSLLKDAKDPSGTVTLKDDEEYSALDYKIASETDMAFLFKDKAGKAVIKVAISGTSYKLDSIKSEKQGKSAWQRVSVDFTDDGHWTTDFFVHFPDCNPEDVQAPEKISIKMKRAQPLWQGKAALHSPRWPNGTCDTPITDTSGIDIDTDIVGEDLFTTAALFMVPLSVAKLDASNIAAYGIDKVCDNLPDFCNSDGKVHASQETPPSNPFCSLPDGTQTFGTACTASTVPEVKAGTFGSQDLWVSPKELEATKVEVPASLQ